MWWACVRTCEQVGEYLLRVRRLGPDLGRHVRPLKPRHMYVVGLERNDVRARGRNRESVAVLRAAGSGRSRCDSGASLRKTVRKRPDKLALSYMMTTASATPTSTIPVSKPASAPAAAGVDCADASGRRCRAACPHDLLEPTEECNPDAGNDVAYRGPAERTDRAPVGEEEEG